MKHVHTQEGKAFFRALKFQRAPRQNEDRESLPLETIPDAVVNLDKGITSYDAQIPKEQFVAYVAKYFADADVSSIIEKIG